MARMGSRDLYEAIIELRKNEPYTYQRWVCDGAQNIIRTAIRFDEYQNPHKQEGEIGFHRPMNQYIGGWLVSLTLEIMEADLPHQSKLLEKRAVLRQEIEDRCSPDAYDNMLHLLNESRPTFTRVYEDDEFDLRTLVYEDDEFNWHICPLQDIYQEIDYEFQRGWQAIVDKADTDRIHRFEDLLIRGYSSESAKIEFKNAARSLTLMGNCVDYPLSDAVTAGIDHVERFRQIQPELEKIVIAR